MNNNQFDYPNDHRVIVPSAFTPVFESQFIDSVSPPSYFNKTIEKRQIKFKIWFTLNK